MGERVAENAVWCYPEPLDGCIDVRDHVAFYWDRVDAWFEEDERVYSGPKDPYTRVDCLQSSRNVSIGLNGVTLARTDHPVMLLETGLPHRYYVPPTDVLVELLPSERTVGSPYKGEARYFHVRVDDETHENVAWSYPYPTPEVAKIAGYVCFPQGRVDMHVDGELQEKPRSRWD